MEEVKQTINNTKRKTIALSVFTAIAIIGIITAYFYLRYKDTHITTDDAFVEGHIHTIASKINGTVKTVYVKDNQPVKKGELLLELDPVDYDIRVTETSAGLNTEKAKLSEKEATIESSKKQLSEITARMGTVKANLELQEANLKQAEMDIKRAEALFKKDAISKERYEKTQTAYDVSMAQVKAAREQVKQSEMAIETQKAIIRQAEASKTSQSSVIKQKEASLRAAQNNYSYTKIYSPSDGYVTKKSVEVGNQIGEGQPLLVIVPLDDIWITANYKETQLEDVKPGQKVKIKVDTYSGKVFRGKVESIMAGTGAVFSLFPPENATGNYVKVVQRIPVKIALDKDTDTEHILRIGTSVVPTILIDSSHLLEPR